MKEKLKISDLDKLKFTSLPKRSGAIHFKYDNIDYHVYPNVNEEDWEQTFLNKGRMKNYKYREEIGYVDEYISREELIKFKHNRKVLSSIDKINFVEVLYNYDLIDIGDNSIKIDALNKQYGKITNEYLEKKKKILQQIDVLQAKYRAIYAEELKKQERILAEEQRIYKKIEKSN